MHEEEDMDKLGEVWKRGWNIDIVTITSPTNHLGHVTFIFTILGTYSLNNAYVPLNNKQTNKHIQITLHELTQLSAFRQTNL